MSAENAKNSWHGALIDAYCHVGVPKYGSLPDVILHLKRLGIARCVLVLGPGIPDLDSLAAAHRILDGNVRLVGIPFGATEAQRLELGEVQLRLGISGMRLMPDELEPNRRLIDRLGELGRWLYAINPYGEGSTSDMTMRFLLEWLERHDNGQIASPHFLRPRRFEDVVEDVGLFQALLEHPRFHAIFSRQGGVQSREPYPHRDLLVWVEQIAEHVTWERTMWGSEFPIIYQRSEQPEAVRDWILNLDVEISDQQSEDFYANNARRLLFDGPAPAHEIVQVPDWVEAQIDQDQTVYLFPSNVVHIPMADHAVLLSKFMEEAESHPGLTYADFIAGLLSGQAALLRTKGD